MTLCDVANFQLYAASRGLSATAELFVKLTLLSTVTSLEFVQEN